jgi:hypothetical protein
VGSPTCSCQREIGSCEVKIVERTVVDLFYISVHAKLDIFQSLPERLIHAPAPLWVHQQASCRILLLGLQCLDYAEETHGRQFFDHWLFENRHDPQSKYSAPRMLSCSGCGDEVGGSATGNASREFFRIDFTLLVTERALPWGDDSAAIVQIRRTGSKTKLDSSPGDRDEFIVTALQHLGPLLSDENLPDVD